MQSIQPRDQGVQHMPNVIYIYINNFTGFSIPIYKCIIFNKHCGSKESYIKSRNNTCIKQRSHKNQLLLCHLNLINTLGKHEIFDTRRKQTLQTTSKVCSSVQSTNKLVSADLSPKNRYGHKVSAWIADRIKNICSLHIICSLYKVINSEY